MGTRVRRGMPAGDCSRPAPPRDIGPSKPEVEVLRRFGWRAGRSKPGSSLEGELAPEATRELMVGRGGGSRPSSSAMRAKRSFMELARERGCVAVRRMGPPFTGLEVPERDGALVLEII